MRGSPCDGGTWAVETAGGVDATVGAAPGGATTSNEAASAAAGVALPASIGSGLMATEAGGRLFFGGR